VAPRIEDYAVIGDGRSAALVSREGSIDWLCWPRFDSPSLFAALLDTGKGGAFRLGPNGPSRTRRRYLPGSNVLETTFFTQGGTLVLSDLMSVATEDEKRASPLPEHELLRVIECAQGAAQVELAVTMRPDYARTLAKWSDGGPLGLRASDRHGLYTLRGDVPITLHGDRAVAHFKLKQGERAAFSLCFESQAPALLPPLGAFALGRASRTRDFWAKWIARCTYDGPYRDAVERGLLTLKLLSYAPSGAIIAAPTTSLPERVGGPLNWDYRFCWLRDAAMTARAFFDLGFPDEATAFVSWLLHGTRLSRPRIDPLYDVFGNRPGRERTLDHLRGYRDSKPVRINNAAVGQVQLDVYGEVIDAVTQLWRRGVGVDRETARMLRDFGREVSRSWRRADHGIWEPREGPAHNTHSRLLCWAALDRLLELRAGGALPRFDFSDAHAQRAQIRADIEEHGWNPDLASYTQTLGGETLDASLLLMGWYGFAHPADARLRSTLERIRTRLSAGPALLFRYEQSREVQEGAFGICSFWAIDLMARGAGSLVEAERWFRQVQGYANDVGLFAEEMEPETGVPMGNVPQAFTHVGVVNAALTLEDRWRKEARAAA
jgi:GH15 family glucan-1,4-alpha-glucosidase